MKAPQERKTKKKITDRDLGYPNIYMDGDEDHLTVGEILEGRNGPATLRSREEVETLRDFCEAWLEYDAQSDEE